MTNEENGSLQSILKKLEASEELLRIQNTALEKATHEAQESNRLKSEFLANVSHELRTPLNGIIGFAELLYDDKVDLESPKYKTFIGNIITSANQLLALINDVLDLAKIEAGKMDFYPEKLNIAWLFSKAKDTFQAITTEKNINLDMRIDPALAEITIDTEKFTQVLYNYVSNALKFSSQGGKVIVRVRPDSENQFRLEVEDTGIGVAQKDLSELFDEFHQLDASPSKRYPGTGLGLSLAKRIVEAQGGTVGASSIYGKGSIFYAVLPIKPHHKPIVSDQVKDAQAPPGTEKTPRILVVERASRERNLIVAALIKEGYTVVTAANVTSAIEHHREHRFDAIILDLFEPNMDEWEIIRTLRSKLPALEAPPIIIKVMVEQPISLGFKIHDFLIKPVKPLDLLSALEWVGVSSHNNKSVLVIDSDQKSLDFATTTLTEQGFRVICSTNKVNGLLALETRHPDVVLLDPFMSEMDGFEFLRSYRQTERGLYTPLIIWTVSELTPEERKRFKNSIQRIMLTSEDLRKNILSELEKDLPPVKM